MRRTLKEQWRDLRSAKPGTRFQHRYRQRKHSRRSPLWKPLYLVGGILIFGLGIVLLPMPGPGFLVIFVGAALIAEESWFVATWMDWLEMKIRLLAAYLRRKWKSISLPLKVLIGILVASAAAGTGWAAYAIFVS